MAEVLQTAKTNQEHPDTGKELQREELDSAVKKLFKDEELHKLGAVLLPLDDWQAEQSRYTRVIQLYVSQEDERYTTETRFISLLSKYGLKSVGRQTDQLHGNTYTIVLRIPRK